MSELRERQAAGLEYLQLATALLQRDRLAHPTAGVWEAADLQWWWRRDQHAHPAAATFWFRDDAPVAALVFTNWEKFVGCDVIGMDAEGAATAWSRAGADAERYAGRTVETAVGEDDPISQESAKRAGFEPTDELAVPNWMDAEERPPVSPLPEGFEVRDREADPSRPHHMIGRSGEHVAERLAETSLYRPDLDLFVVAPDGEVAAYALFWADPVTGVGLVEPMRTEDAYQNRGLARHLLTAGLHRLARAGSTRLKISFMESNSVAKHVYLSAGFQPDDADRTWRRSA